MNFLLVALGGAMGSCCRYALSVMWLKPQSLFPWPTWGINLIGCALAGVFFAFSQNYPVLQQQTRLLLMVGILGGFTTFSSFGLETFQLLRQGQSLLALAYVLSSVILGVCLLATAYWLTQMCLVTQH